MKITAEQAKKNADEINEIKHTAQLSGILSQIESLSNEGKYSINISVSLMQETIKELKLLGFNVERGGRMNEEDYSISWVNIK